MMAGYSGIKDDYTGSECVSEQAELRVVRVCNKEAKTGAFLEATTESRKINPCRDNRLSSGWISFGQLAKEK